MKNIILLSKNTFECIKDTHNFFLVDKKNKYWKVILSTSTQELANKAFKRMEELAKNNKFKVNLKIFNKKDIVLYKES